MRPRASRAHFRIIMGMVIIIMALTLPKMWMVISQAIAGAFLLSIGIWHFVERE